MNSEKVNLVSGTDWSAPFPAQPMNLDFTDDLKHWDLSAERGDGQGYQIGLDKAGRRSGSPSPYVEARVPDPQNDGCIRQRCCANPFLGKRIRCSAWIKTENVTKDMCFYLHIDAPDRVRVWNSNNSDAPLRGTTDWRRVEYVAEVAPNTQGFIFGLDLEGEGKAWVDDIRFEVVGDEVPLTPIDNDFKIEDDQISDQVSWLDGSWYDAAPLQPVNPDFAQGLDGWANDNPTHDAADNYTLGLDKSELRPGAQCATLASIAPKPTSYGTLMQNIRADEFRGKRLRYSAWIRTEQAAAAGLWIVLQGATEKSGYYNMTDQHIRGITNWNMTNNPIRGTTDWKQYTWVLDVLKDALLISFGIDLEGTGKMWVDEFHFETVGDDVPLTP